MGRIEELIESDVDGVQRAAVVRISSGKRLKRPYRLIYPLEKSSTMDTTAPDENTNAGLGKSEQDSNSADCSSKRSTRSAAKAARLKIASNLRAAGSDSDDAE